MVTRPPAATAWGRPLLGLGWLAVLALLLTFVALAGRLDAAAGSEQPDLIAPDFTAATFSSSEEPVVFEEFRGRPVVLNFWASWHADARAEATILERLSQDYTFRDQGVAVIGVAVFETERPAKDLVRGLVLTYPNGFDADGEIARRYGVLSVPTTLFIDRDGRVVRQRAGAQTEAEFRRSIAEIAR